ncbi:Zn-dependent oxidoreductase [Enterobacillus tribolii]|uniref:L-gulonate 5-dehydrogenase n=1 Tax=Enterobacillus tribolii TaxID=1487935 RepID=A0A370QS37_9GAMM|nr:Zn-dependent oxidoreductase [Enterobacillus tribolii]MBW7983711.1 Zn-dependent oxidoreductase [Enterobacillus tribolii]RDK92074.1 L-gulonate 5-dehydrogenase [Enterobacillus tribolii]
MKSVVIQQPGSLVIEERPLPQPQPGEVRIRVESAGICGSDVHIYRGHNPFAKYPRVIGHEFFGRIDAVGEGVSPARIGERAVGDPVVSCGHCYPCSVGRPNVCAALQVIGVHRDGGFSEYVTLPARNAHAVPDAIPDAEATMIEPFTIAANICAQMNPGPLDTALIYGAGPMGLTTIQALRGVYGVKEIIVADRLDERLAMARENGADRIINNGTADLRTELEKTGTRPTLIIDAACHPAILPEAIGLASPAARIGIMGFSADPCVISQQGITSKELTIYSSRLNSNRFPTVIGWMAERKIHPEKLITHKFHYTHVVNALELFEQDQKSCCKVLLEF